MKDHLLALLANTTNALQARNQAREYLQALILQSLQRAGAMVPLAFHGGTALRFLYDSQRYSEDLDFALEGNFQLYAFQAYLNSIRHDLEAQGYSLSLKVSDHKTVHSAFVRFPGLPFDLGLSAQRDEVLAVKIEVDTHPPPGAVMKTTLVRRHVLLNLQHHDEASLLAGKLHALLQRPFLKGRDVYDLVWYLSAPDWPAPNLDMLNHALVQTGWNGEYLTHENWPATIRKRLADMPWQQVLADVEPFLQSSQEIAMLTRANLDLLLENRANKG